MRGEVRREEQERNGAKRCVKEVTHIHVNEMTHIHVKEMTHTHTLTVMTHIH